MKKFAFVAALALIVAGASTSSAAYMGTPLKVGSRGTAVSTMQMDLNKCLTQALAIDGAFGPHTKTVVMQFQAAKGITADGIVGPVTYAQIEACGAAAGSQTGSQTQTGSTTLKGGAGDLTISSTTTGVKSAVKEDSSEKVLGMKLKADGSDIAVTSVKVQFENNSGNGSTRLNKYVDEVSVMLGTKEVGSVSADDFSKDGNVYSKSIALSSAVVKENVDANLYVVVKTVATVDELTADLDLDVMQVRYEDATGAIFSEGYSVGDMQKTFGFDDASSDDKLSIMSSTADPDAGNLVVDETSTSDEYLVGAFKLKADTNSSDITINEFPVVFTINDSANTANSDSSESIIDSVTVKIGSDEFTAEYDSDTVTNGDGTGTYIVDTNGDVTIEAGDTVEVKIYATFKDQDTNYGSGTIVSADVVGDDIDADGQDQLSATNLNGQFNGEDQTLMVTGAAVTYVSSAYTPVVPPSYSGGPSVEGVISVTFKVEAIGGDVVLAGDGSDINNGVLLANLITGTATETGKTLSCSGVTLSGGDYTISEGDTKTCTYSVSFSAKTGFIKLEVTDVAGTAVSNIISNSY